MTPFLKKLARDTRGASMIEFSMIAFLLLTLTMGAVDFSLAFFQWNAATKAVQLGARLAAVSDPVCSELSNWTGVVPGTYDPGDYPPPAFEWVYDGNISTANCSSGSADTDAVDLLLNGRGGNSGLGNSNTFPGMKQLFDQIDKRLTRQNIIVRYTSSGLGYSGRPGGAVPTITVEVTGVTFDFYLLNGVFGMAPIPIPGLRATVTGEDLSRAGS